MAIMNQPSVSTLGPLRPKIVGVEDQIEKVMDLLAFGERRSNNEATRCVILMGMGGIGKSEIARYVYSNLIDIRGEKMRHHCINLPLRSKSELDEQKNMLKALMRQTIIQNEFYTCEVGMAEISNNLKSLDEPVFLLLDNLNLTSPLGSDFTTTTSDILKQLLPEAQYFPIGSTIVVTTREQEETPNTLKSMGFNIMKMQVQCLGDKGARSLLYASMNTNDANDVPEYIIKKWETRLLKTCGGWPLALQHAGGRIRRGQSTVGEDAWKKVVESLEQGKLVDGSLYSSLKSSIVNLDKESKAAYLAIVQCYEGEEWENVSYYVGYEEMDVLWQYFIIQKLPFVCKQRGCINIASIHDVYKVIGFSIIRDEETQSQMNDKLVTKWDDELIKEIDIAEESTNLALICQNLETKYRMSKHLRFELPHSYQHKMPWTWLQNCTNLITMELYFKSEHQQNSYLPITPLDDEKAQEFCKSLPQNLLRLRIVSWELLTQHFSIKNYHELKCLSLEDCPNLKKLQLSSSLHYLSLQHCPMLSLPQELFSDNDTLRYLNIQDCDVCDQIIPQYLPQSLQQLRLCACKYIQSLKIASFVSIPFLKHLLLDDCISLVDINMHSMSSMESLHINDCTKLQILELHDLPSLKYLDLGNSRFWLKHLKMSNLSFLKMLVSDDIKNFKMEDLSSMANTKILELRSYEVLETLDLSGTTSLEEIFLNDCIKLKSIKLGDHASLKKLSLNRCNSLKIPKFSSMASLQCLYLKGLTHLKTLPDLSGLMSLEVLSLADCINLENIQLGNPTSLKKLSLSRCRKLKFSYFSSMASLQWLFLDGWERLKIVPYLNIMTSLEVLSLDDCINLKSIQLGNPASLKMLWLSRCNHLENLDFSSMVSLQELYLNGWTNLETLPDVKRMTSLQVFSLNGCIMWKSIQHGKHIEMFWLNRQENPEISEFS